MREEPLLRIDQSRSGSSAEFYLVEDVLVADSLIVVADRGSGQLRFFDRQSGTHRYSVGGRGQGPGEFEWLNWASACGSKLVFAADAIQRRVSTYGPDGELLDTRLVSPMSGAGTLHEVFCDDQGHLFGAFQSTRVDATAVLSAYRPLWTIRQIGPYDSEALATIAGHERMLYRNSDNYRIFGKRTVLAAGPGGVLVGDGEEFSFVILPADGGERMKVDFPVEPEMVRDAQIDEVVRTHIAGVIAKGASPDISETISRNYAELEYPTYFPPYNRAEVDREGRWWVQRYPSPLPDAPSKRLVWEVFSALGEHLGSVVMPPGFSAMWFGSGVVAGRTRVENDIEVIDVFPLPAFFSR